MKNLHTHVPKDVHPRKNPELQLANEAIIINLQVRELRSPIPTINRFPRAVNLGTQTSLLKVKGRPNEEKQ
jgi:hypothetical protein